MKPSGIGGMAVMEGVMMKNRDQYAVAVRKPDNEIVVEKSTYSDFSDKVKLFKLPIFRGMLAFVDSMVIGVKVLNFSASFFEDEEETDKEKANKKKEKSDKKKEIKQKAHKDKAENVLKDKEEEEKRKKESDSRTNALLMVFAVLLSIVFSVTLFMVIPVLISNLLSKVITNIYLMSFIEGVLRLGIFVGYVILAARMPEIKRVFMYHGAEHKTINCLENGFELTVENIRWQSKQHKRCGTSFMLLVILISLIFFIILPVNGLLWKVISRILLVPFIAGVSYEFIRLAGKSESRIIDILSKPGLLMQGLTTKEPDDAMIEVAIQSVGAVFDWRAFLDSSNSIEDTTEETAAEVTAAEVKDVSKITAKAGEGKPARPKASVKAKDNGADAAKAAEIKEAEIKAAEVTAAGTADNKTSDTKAIVKPADNKASDARNAVKAADTPAAKGAKGKASKSSKAGKEPESAKIPEVLAETEAANESAVTIENFKKPIGIKSVVSGTIQPDTGRRNTGNTPSIHYKLAAANHPEDEDDEILKALDKFFDEK